MLVVGGGSGFAVCDDFVHRFGGTAGAEGPRNKILHRSEMKRRTRSHIFVRSQNRRSIFNTSFYILIENKHKQSIIEILYDRKHFRPLQIR